MLRNYGRDLLKIFISVIKISKRTENFMCTVSKTANLQPT